MNRLIENFGHLPQNALIENKSRFEPGQIGSFKIVKNKTFIEISDGINPNGIIDDIRADRLRHVSYDELVYIKIDLSFVDLGGEAPIARTDLKIKLKHDNIIAGSFNSKDLYVKLNAKSGHIIIPEGARCSSPYWYTDNNIFTGNCYISYAYTEILCKKNTPIEDSTGPNEKATLWDKIS